MNMNCFNPHYPDGMDFRRQDPMPDMSSWYMDQGYPPCGMPPTMIQPRSESNSRQSGRTPWMPADTSMPSGSGSVRDGMGSMPDRMGSMPGETAPMNMGISSGKHGNSSGKHGNGSGEHGSYAGNARQYGAGNRIIWHSAKIWIASRSAWAMCRCRDGLSHLPLMKVFARGTIFTGAGSAICDGEVPCK